MQTKIAGPNPKKIAVGTIASSYRVDTSAGMIDGWAKYFNQVEKATNPMATR
jgi:hypothetical protein